MQLDMKPLLRGEIRKLPVSFSLGDGNASENDPTSVLYQVTFTTPVTVEGVITSESGYMHMALNVNVSFTAPCARCLEEVKGSLSLPVERTVVEAGTLENEDSEDSDEYVQMENGILDVDLLLSELLELNFPSKFLCKEDCLGLCPTCGKNLNEGPCACETKEMDPRLEPLRKLLEEMKAEEAGANK